MRLMETIFSRIATRYDRMNSMMSLALDRRWRRIALQGTALPPQGAVLDLACGTGEFALELIRRFPDAAITGVDLTPEMLDLARKKMKGYD